MYRILDVLCILDIIKTNDRSNIFFTNWAGVANAGLALVGKGLSIVDKMAGLTTAESIIFGTMTNSPLLGLGMAINMGISKHALVYTVNDLYNDTFGKYKQLTWRGKIWFLSKMF